MFSPAFSFAWREIGDLSLIKGVHTGYLPRDLHGLHFESRILSKLKKFLFTDA